MKRYLCEAGVLLKDFGAYATGLSNRIRAAAHAFAARERRPVRYLHSTALSKEQLAHALAERDRIDSGLVGLFDIVEPCLTCFVRGDRAAHRLHWELRPGKCLHRYFYFQHAGFGLMHLRVQSWFPFQVTVCVNGRLWLANQLARAGIDSVQRDNSFVWLADPARAQRLADAQLRLDWPAALAPLLAECHPLAAEILRPLGQHYDWSIDQSEYATDVMFRSPAALAAIYPQLIHHGVRHCGTPEVLRFLGRIVPAHGHVHRGFAGEVETELKHRPEGMRLKHYLAGNWIKLYDKHGQVIRWKRRSRARKRSASTARRRESPGPGSAGCRCARTWPTRPAARRSRPRRTTATSPRSPRCRRTSRRRWWCARSAGRS